jgi:hypothetical protein
MTLQRSPGDLAVSCCRCVLAYEDRSGAACLRCLEVVPARRQGA